jgi:hypothetical protein
MTWRVIKRPDQSVVHIVPIGDFEPHDEDASCRCEPELEPVEDAFRDLLVHNAYDESLNDKSDVIDE